MITFYFGLNYPCTFSTPTYDVKIQFFYCQGLSENLISMNVIQQFDQIYINFALTDVGVYSLGFTGDIKHYIISPNSAKL